MFWGFVDFFPHTKMESGTTKLFQALFMFFCAKTDFVGRFFPKMYRNFKNGFGQYLQQLSLQFQAWYTSDIGLHNDAWARVYLTK